MNILHNNLKEHLTVIGSSFNIVETLGYLAGFASSNCSFESYNQGLLTYFSVDANSNSINLDLELIRQNIESTKKDLDKNDFRLFFDNDKNLTSKLLSLSDWSKNYILSINYLINQKLIKNTVTLQEILHDFTEISKISSDYDIGDEDALSSYEEISNYVVASSYHIYNESKLGTSQHD